MKLRTGKRTGADVRYYPVMRKWKQIRPIIKSVEATKIWRHDMRLYTVGRWENEDVGRVPADNDSCDWRCNKKHHPLYDYACWGACHWLVNLNFYVARILEPTRNWRIVTSDLHSTVWDDTSNQLFDINYFSLGVPATEAWKRAFEGGTICPLDCELDVGLAEHYLAGRTSNP